MILCILPYHFLINIKSQYLFLYGIDYFMIKRKMPPEQFTKTLEWENVQQALPLKKRPVRSSPCELVKHTVSGARLEHPTC